MVALPFLAPVLLGRDVQPQEVCQGVGGVMPEPPARHETGQQRLADAQLLCDSIAGKAGRTDSSSAATSATLHEDGSYAGGSYALTTMSSSGGSNTADTYSELGVPTQSGYSG